MMRRRRAIKTDQAPEAIGTYSQAIEVNKTVYLSGQIALQPGIMTLQQSSIEAEIKQVFSNVKAVVEASGGGLQDVVKLNVYLTDLEHFATVNTIMAEFFDEPYPARAAVQVAALPKGARVEVDGVVVLA